MKTSTKVLHWAPRIICILGILFVSLFAFNSFTAGLSLGQQLANLFVRLIPSFILAALLVVAWKWELTGGIIFMVIGVAFSPVLFFHNYNMNHSVGLSLLIILAITFPFILTGFLFVWSQIRKKKERMNISPPSTSFTGEVPMASS